MSREDVRPCTAVQTLEVGEFSTSVDQGAEGTSCSATLATGNVLEVVPDDESVECLSSINGDESPHNLQEKFDFFPTDEKMFPVYRRMHQQAGAHEQCWLGCRSSCVCRMM